MLPSNVLVMYNFVTKRISKQVRLFR